MSKWHKQVIQITQITPHRQHGGIIFEEVTTTKKLKEAEATDNLALKDNFNTSLQCSNNTQRKILKIKRKTKLDSSSKYLDTNWGTFPYSIFDKTLLWQIVL